MLFRHERDLTGYGRQHKLHTRDVKKLRDRIARQFPALRALQYLDVILPSGARVCTTTVASGATVYVSNGVPIFFERSTKALTALCPTLFTQWKAPELALLPTVVVHEAISEYVLKGADVLVSGMAGVTGLETLEKGQPLCVKVRGNNMPFAVGVAAAPGSDISEAFRVGKPLRAVMVLHSYNDGLFKRQDLGYLPAPEGFSPTIIMSVQDPAQGDGEDQGDSGSNNPSPYQLKRVPGKRSPGLSFAGNLASPIDKALSPSGDRAGGMTQSFRYDELLDRSEQVDTIVGDLRDSMQLAESKHASDMDKMISQQVELLRHAEVKTSSLAGMCRDCLERTAVLRDLGEQNHHDIKEIERCVMELYRFKQLTELDMKHRDDDIRLDKMNISGLLIDAEKLKSGLSHLEKETTELLGELLGHSRSMRTENRQLRDEVSSLRQDVTLLAKTMDSMCTHQEMSLAVTTAREEARRLLDTVATGSSHSGGNLSTLQTSLQDSRRREEEETRRNSAARRQSVSWVKRLSSPRIPPQPLPPAQETHDELIHDAEAVPSVSDDMQGGVRSSTGSEHGEYVVDQADPDPVLPVMGRVPFVSFGETYDAEQDGNVDNDDDDDNVADYHSIGTGAGGVSESKRASVHRFKSLARQPESNGSNLIVAPDGSGVTKGWVFRQIMTPDGSLVDNRFKKCFLAASSTSLSFGDREDVVHRLDKGSVQIKLTRKMACRTTDDGRFEIYDDATGRIHCSVVSEVPGDEQQWKRNIDVLLGNAAHSEPIDTGHQQPVVYSGFIYKQALDSSKLRLSNPWKRRFLVLNTGAQLIYADKEHEALNLETIKGRIQLETSMLCTTSAGSSDEDKCVFEIVAFGSSAPLFRAKCDSEAQCEEWIKQVNQVVAVIGSRKAREPSIPPPGAPPPPAPNGSNMVTEDTVSKVPAGNGAAASKKRMSTFFGLQDHEFDDFNDAAKILNVQLEVQHENEIGAQSVGTEDIPSAGALSNNSGPELSSWRPPAPPTTAAKMKGVIYKLPKNQDKFRMLPYSRWARRYLELEGRILRYASREDELDKPDKVRGAVMLRKGMKVTTTGDMYGFEVLDDHGESVFMCKTDSDISQRNWMTSIEKAINSD